MGALIEIKFRPAGPACGWDMLAIKPSTYKRRLRMQLDVASSALDATGRLAAMHRGLLTGLLRLTIDLPWGYRVGWRGRVCAQRLNPPRVLIETGHRIPSSRFSREILPLVYRVQQPWRLP